MLEVLGREEVVRKEDFLFGGMGEKDNAEARRGAENWSLKDKNVGRDVGATGGTRDCVDHGAQGFGRSPLSKAAKRPKLQLRKNNA
jgi:hypothetical protein